MRTECYRPITRVTLGQSWLMGKNGGNTVKNIAAFTALAFCLSFATGTAFAQSGEGMSKDDSMAKPMGHEKMGKDHEKMGKSHDSMKKDGDKMGDGMKKDDMSK